MASQIIGVSPFIVTCYVITTHLEKRTSATHRRSSATLRQSGISSCFDGAEHGASWGQAVPASLYHLMYTARRFFIIAPASRTLVER